ncbi:MAG: NAD(P)H-hydrate dehydratase [Henriciella sp.]
MIENSPQLWQKDFPRPGLDAHKYHRGHGVIIGSANYTGATRLAAAACSRIGAGLVTVMSDEAYDIYRTTLPADIMVRNGAVSAVKKVTALLAGPGGCPVGAIKTLATLSETVPIVLDADAIINRPDLNGRTAPLIITPHDGEFDQAFPDFQGSRVQRAKDVARHLAAIVVLKGRETLIVAPDGELVINRHASPYLAKAGSGDVLAGMITGLLAQAMPAFSACCAAVWMHGEAGLRIGPGLIPQDIIADLKGQLKAL